MVNGADSPEAAWQAFHAALSRQGLDRADEGALGPGSNEAGGVLRVGAGVVVLLAALIVLPAATLSLSSAVLREMSGGPMTRS